MENVTSRLFYLFLVPQSDKEPFIYIIITLPSEGDEKAPGARGGPRTASIDLD